MKRAFIISLLLGWAAASGSSNVLAVAEHPPEAAFVDAQGRVWTWRDDGLPQGAWTHLVGMDDANVALVAAGDVVIAHRGGGVVLWSGKGAGVRPLP